MFGQGVWRCLLIREDGTTQLWNGVQLDTYSEDGVEILEISETPAESLFASDVEFAVTGSTTYETVTLASFTLRPEPPVFQGDEIGVKARDGEIDVVLRIGAAYAQPSPSTEEDAWRASR